MKGAFVISLDFEGLWGAIGSSDATYFKERVSYINEYVPRLLNLFQKYNIRATWATVGALLCEDSEEALQYLSEDIVYKKWNVSIRDFIGAIKNISSENDDKYFNSKCVALVAKNENQEMGAHTFSHFYTLEEGVTEEMMRQELDAQDKIVSSKLGKKCTSIVFPRNMVNKEYLSIIKEKGYTAFRGRQDPFIRKKRVERNKIIDFLDSYFPIRSDLCYKMEDIQQEQGLYNIKASMYYRTYSKNFRWFEALKTKRVKKEMRRAAKKGLVFHLWWHPHNMASNMEANFQRLEKILAYYTGLNEKYGYTSMSMADVVAALESCRTRS